ncbi:membrane protein DedA with SNARE-associated domain [Blastomonas natatoria]|uniref:Membrane protein DedA with SNARE-associated domain n=1 Tax=Blastomonas natatoria TaxID=34015 RepID=A0A2V3VEY4_9SPHN|nr:DedA family protein [Blastomonas natatoria]PXW75189.1 membrane protein DedA with SNARE-associated domain [Blastomonas natatoria]
MNDLVLSLVARGGYWGVALLMALENVFPPIPSELIMGLAGIEAGKGNLNLWAVLLAGTVGSVAGNYVWYWVGRKVGLERLDHFVDRWGRWLTLDRKEVEKFNRLFHRHGASTIFFARMVPTIRTLISLPAGIFQMSRRKFLLWTFAGAGVWNIIFAGIGFQLGARVEEIDAWTGPISTGVIVIIVVFYVLRVIVWRPDEQGVD